MAGRETKPGGGSKAAGDDESFLGRWSRRKAEAKTAEPTAADPTTNADPAELAEAERTEAMPAAEAPGETPAIDPSTLPDIDSLGRGSDFSPFMQAGVPPALKIKALRKLWRVKPELANLDGLIDYGEDLTGSFKVVDQLKTAYEVGRGFLRDPEDEVVDKEEEDSAGKEVVGEVEASESPQTTETHRAAAGDTDEAENVSAGHESTDKV